MSQVTEQSVRFQTALASIKLIQASEIGRAVQQECRDRKSGSAGMPRPSSYAVFCLKKKRLMAETEVLVGTRKGLFVLRGDRGGALEIAARCFEKEPVEYACFDERSGTYLASVTHWPEEVAKYFPGS